MMSDKIDNGFIQPLINGGLDENLTVNQSLDKDSQKEESSFNRPVTKNDIVILTLVAIITLPIALLFIHVIDHVGPIALILFFIIMLPSLILLYFMIKILKYLFMIIIKDIFCS